MKEFVEFFCAPVPFLIIFAGLFFSVRLKFFWIRHPIKMISAMIGTEKKEGVSPFRAVTLALSGTLGVGNIVGVAGAIAIGGFGSVFWMWISALCAMVLKYAEIVLAVSHRRERGGERFGRDTQINQNAMPIEIHEHAVACRTAGDRQKLKHKRFLACSKL